MSLDLHVDALLRVALDVLRSRSTSRALAPDRVPGRAVRMKTQIPVALALDVDEEMPARVSRERMCLRIRDVLVGCSA
jgi:hypothetical protein